jgi:hypothetical protein
VSRHFFSTPARRSGHLVILRRAGFGCRQDGILIMTIEGGFAREGSAKLPGGFEDSFFWINS